MMSQEHPTKMVSLRLEESHISTIDRLARAEGQSRSEWFRTAILAQLIHALAGVKEEKVPRGTPEPQPVPEIEIPKMHDEIHFTEPTVRGHHIDCIKNYDHEGECL